MIDNIEVLYHSCIKLSLNKIIYIDPYKIDKLYADADLILITHEHYDHYSEEDIKKIKNKNTVIVTPEILLDKILRLGFSEEKIITVTPNNTYGFENIILKTIPAYNTNKLFHPKEKNWVGYIIEINSVIYYIAGDTDITEENKEVKCDIAFVPVGGTYTMNYKESASLVNRIKPKIAVPIHYGSIVGTEKDALNFIKLINSDIEGAILMH